MCLTAFALHTHMTRCAFTYEDLQLFAIRSRARRRRHAAFCVVVLRSGAAAFQTKRQTRPCHISPRPLPLPAQAAVARSRAHACLAHTSRRGSAANHARRSRRDPTSGLDVRTARLVLSIAGRASSPCIRCTPQIVVSAAGRDLCRHPVLRGQLRAPCAVCALSDAGFAAPRSTDGARADTPSRRHASRWGCILRPSHGRRRARRVPQRVVREANMPAAGVGTDTPLWTGSTPARP